VEDQGLLLISPALHSTERKYGVTDFGLNGILSFFSTHQCNSLCSCWSKPGEISLQGDSFRPTRVTAMEIPRSTSKSKRQSTGASKSRSFRKSAQNISKELKMSSVKEENDGEKEEDVEEG
jgi:hypothetical protein